MTAICGLFALLFAGLGVWQVERLQWKLDLIRRIDLRLAAGAVDLPPPADWRQIDPRSLEYTKVRATGRYDYARETKVDALTELGPGWWLLTPLDTGKGVVLVNRGFVPKAPVPQSNPRGFVSVTGLLRISEPGGRFLRSNKPDASLWYSRDVPAIAKERGLANVAPFFVDAGRDPNGETWPRGGLTVVHFRNAHLVYALTWFGLAALSLFGLVLIWRRSAKQG
ncbi:SURF1 family protein [Sphingomonas sp. KRR8]|uniref:SURF1 family protein n=1 Tax=Sphingomonas sp. KRR8 TaxID=2942996 RepID=UPI00202253B9|nr:SURF1 family protein [Sphingomonas sp. KRR8]URD60758.1 SURF1 family protein [Sphingomonas sp. KRR8]